MDATPLYDLSPLVRLMLMGVAVALLPLAWLAWRHRHATRPQKLRALTVLTLFLTFDLVLFGAFTRLTDSGLGCPDWPGCYGHASPLGARESIASAQEALPTGPVTHGKAWIEMIHRYLATGVGVLIIASVVLSVLWRDRSGALGSRTSGDGVEVRISPGLPLLILVWVLAQGAFGALTVTMKLFPAIVTLHLLGGVGLLALLAVQAARFHGVVQVTRPTSREGVSAAQLSPGLRSLLWLTTALVLVQIALGAAGIRVPRDADQQEAVLGEAVAVGADLSGVRRGDLVFWPGHVAIVSDPQTLVHANAWHMMVALEPLAPALARIAAAGSKVRTVKRLPVLGG